MMYTSPDDAQNSYGPGDLEFGIKWCLMQEDDNRPMLGIFPLLEIPTGDAHRGLGNGETWGKFPLWLQKSWGGWTTYGGAGYAINSAPGQRNYTFGGWLLQRDFDAKMTLGGEIFAEEKSSHYGSSFSLFNLGVF